MENFYTYYPFSLNSAHTAQLTNEIDAKLDFLLSFPRGQRLGDKEFGLPALFLEQITDSELEEEKSLFVFQIQKLFYDYIQGAQLVSVDISKKDHVAMVDIVYQPLASKKEEQFQWRVDLISKLPV